MKPFSRLLPPALVVAFGVLCAYGLRRDLALISLAPILHSWDLVLVAGICSLLNYCVRIFRWQRYLARLGFSLPLRFTSLTYLAGFAFTVSPGKVGEMARARYYAGLGISLSDVAGAFCVERLMDLFAMLALAALILTMAPRYHAVIWSTGAILAAVLVLLTSLRWSSIAEWLEGAPHIPGRLRRLAFALARALGAARSLLEPGPLLFGFGLALLAWGLEGLGLFVLADMFPPAHVEPTVGVRIYAVAVLVGAISFLPGGLGSTEAIMTALLASQGYALVNALLITIVCRMLTLWLAVCIGWIAVLALRSRLVLAVAPWQ
jgi:uncharacterized protein (TIRG00374 family)